MTRSLRWRIQLWHATILASVIALFGAIIYLQQRSAKLREIDNELSSAIEVLQAQLGSAPRQALLDILTGGNAASSKAALGLVAKLKVPNTFAPRQVRHKFELPYFSLRRPDGSEVLSSQSDAPTRERTIYQQRPVPVPDQTQFRKLHGSGPLGIRILVGRYIGPDMSDLIRLFWLVVGAGAGVLVLGLVGGWVLSAKSVQPLLEISRVADEISQHSLAKRIDVVEMDTELANLGATLNSAFARLEKSFLQQSQFTADASHELRTPLAVIRMHQDLALSKPRTQEEYRIAIETCQRATTRMSQLVDSLLDLSRLDSAAHHLNCGDCEMFEIVQHVIQLATPLAHGKVIEFRRPDGETTIHADAERIEQVVTNLLANALQYSHADGRVVIELNQTSEGVKFTIADSGIGIPASETDRIFDRFYRVERDRSRDAGGSGLGLAICKSIIHSHGGTLSVTSIVGKGSTFQFCLPLRALSNSSSGIG